MPREIVQTVSPVTLIGGGAATTKDLREALAIAPRVVAADGGVALALASGIIPQVVIGDFDSLTLSDRARIPNENLFPIREQDTTDFDKALRNIAAPLILGVGFLGARVDHQLAAMSALVRRADRPCLLLGADEIVFHAPPSLSLDLDPGDIVSLFPFLATTGRSHGLEWPIDNVTLAPGGQVGTSNRALGRVLLEPDAPGLLVIVPRSALARVVGAFLPARPDAGEPAPMRWPARA